MIKKFMLTLALMSLLILSLEPARELFGNFVRLGQPKTHEIQSGDWLSKLAKQYYGDTSYWKELALVNRAPKAALIYPGEEVIIPSFEVIKEVRKTAMLSKVNELVGFQEDLLAAHVSPTPDRTVSAEDKNASEQVGTGSTRPQRDIKTQTNPPGPNQNHPSARKQAGEERNAASELVPEFQDITDPDHRETASFFLSTPAVTALVILGVVVLIGAVLYVLNKRREQEITYFGAAENDEEIDLDSNGGLKPKESKTEAPFILGGSRKEEPKTKTAKRTRSEVEIV
jgi:LysM repeat protein